MDPLTIGRMATLTGALLVLLGAVRVTLARRRDPTDDDLFSVTRTTIRAMIGPGAVVLVLGIFMSFAVAREGEMVLFAPVVSGILLILLGIGLPKAWEGTGPTRRAGTIALEFPMYVFIVLGSVLLLVGLFFILMMANI